MGLRKFKQSQWRIRGVVFTERDELAFSRVLREFEPRVVMFEHDGRHPSRAEFHAMIPNIPTSRSFVIDIYLPTPRQEQTWVPPTTQIEGVAQSQCRCVYRRGEWEWLDPRKKWAFDSPVLGRAEFDVFWPYHDEEMKKFAMKIYRLANKVTWRRSNAGLHACKWSQDSANIRRGLGGGWRVDPSEKVELNKYYDDSLWDDRLPDACTTRGEPPEDWVR